MKKGDMRRDELISTAERLFYQNGYEKTSVQEIIDAMHFSKGGFYHHFDSKLSVLEAICETRARESAQRAIEAARAETDAVAQLNALLGHAPMWTSENETFAALFIQMASLRDGAVMREKMKRCQMENLREPLCEILRRGEREKAFFITDAEGMAELVGEMILRFADEAASVMTDEAEEGRLDDVLIAKLNLYRTAIERMLVAPFGSVEILDARQMHELGTVIARERAREE